VDVMQDGLGVGLDLGEVLGDLVAAGGRLEEVAQ
jgi:hypothetical protein